ncbi:MAG TPA: formyl transferase [Methylocystis sp.]|nr:formyl transferase [Methylocystis sp.]
MTLRAQILASSELLEDWPAELCRRLQRRGVAAGVVTVPGELPLQGLKLLLLLERTLFHLQPLSAVAPPATLDAPDIVIDLSGAAPSEVETPTLYPLFDGAPGDAAIANALLSRRAPVVDILCLAPGQSPRRIATATPALEHRHKFSLSYRAVAAAAAALLCASVERRARGQAFVLDEAPPPYPEALAASPAAFAATTLAQKIAKQLTKLAVHPEHFRIGWRRVGAERAVGQTLVWPAEGYRFIEDDRKRYFTDPFVLAKGGRVFVFCEEFPYATGKGVLSAFEFFEDGAVSPPRLVLEQDHHLSYPQVFERDGALWMIPESSAASRIELYRAERFPDLWRLEAVLVDGVRAADATLIEHDGKLWLFATVAEDGLSDWDALHVYVADKLCGRWRAHPGNPVLIDAASARPAGPMFKRGGELWRPAQDCSHGYGGGLTLCRVDRLDENEFRQTPKTRLKPPRSWRAHGAHTLHHAAGVEVIDVVGWRKR